MTKPTKAKTIKAKLTLKEELLKSSIVNRISPSTICTIFAAYPEDEKRLKAIINHLAPILPNLELAEVKAIINDLNKLI